MNVVICCDSLKQNWFMAGFEDFWRGDQESGLQRASPFSLGAKHQRPWLFLVWPVASVLTCFGTAVTAWSNMVGKPRFSSREVAAPKLLFPSHGSLVFGLASLSCRSSSKLRPLHCLWTIWGLKPLRNQAKGKMRRSNTLNCSCLALYNVVHVLSCFIMFYIVLLHFQPESSRVAQTSSRTVLSGSDPWCWSKWSKAAIFSSSRKSDLGGRREGFFDHFCRDGFETKVKFQRKTTVTGRLLSPFLVQCLWHPARTSSIKIDHIDAQIPSDSYQKWYLFATKLVWSGLAAWLLSFS